MLRLSANEEKELTFEVQIDGVSDFDKVESFFRIVLEGIEYGFPCKVTKESITVSVPPLNKVMAKRIREGEEVDIKLEVVVDGLNLIPWRDRAKLSNPLVIEAKIKDDKFTAKPKFATTLVSEGGQKQKVIVKEQEVEPKEEISENFIDQIVSKLHNLLKPEKVKEQDEIPPMKDEDKEEKEGKPTSERKEKIVNKKDVENLLNETINNFKLNETRKPKKNKKSLTLQEFKKNLTEDDIYKYMERAGTKNPKIQKIVYEQALEVSKSAEPIEILKHVINIMKKKK